MKKFKTVQDAINTIWDTWKSLDYEKQFKMVRKCYCNAFGFLGSYISFDVRNHKIRQWSEQPNLFQPGFEEYQIILFSVEPNWRANSSWTYEEILGEDIPEDTEDIIEWADEKAKEKGYSDFDDLLCNVFAENALNEELIEDEILHFTEFELGIFIEK